MSNTLWAKMHGGTTHFPIALVMVSALFDMASLFFPTTLPGLADPPSGSRILYDYSKGVLMSIEAKAALSGLAAGLALLGITFGLSPFLRPAKAAASEERSANIV